MSSYSSNNGTDIYATTSRFTTAVTATASALMNQSDQNHHDSLLSNSSYKKAMQNALKNKPSVSIQRRSDLGERLNATRYATSSEYYKHAFKSSKAAYQILTHIPDDLLEEIPEESSSTFSLFQGFNAAIPAVNEEIELTKSLGDGDDIMKKLTDGGTGDETNDNTFRLPHGITEDKINQSYSSPKLSLYKQQVSDNLDLLEIRKKLAASEIMEIDNKISKLQELRNFVFKRVEKLEQNEFFLESHLQDINDRLQMIKDYNMEKPDVDDLTIEEQKNIELNGKESESISSEESVDETDKSLFSKSIYGKLQDKPPKFRKKDSKSRKTTPTLQQYYTPGTLIRTIKAHEESVTCFDFDMPFGTIVTASLDNTVRVWDLSRGKCHGLLEGHNAPVSCLQMDDNLVVTGSLDASLKLWDLSRLNNSYGEHEEDNGPCIYSFESHIEEITALSFHNFNLVSGSQDRTIRQWDLQTGHCLQTIDLLWASQSNNTFSNSVDLPSFSTKTSYPYIGALQTYDAALATGTSDGLVRLWDLRSGEVVRTLSGHTGPVTSLQFDDKYLATGSLDRSVRIWDLRTGGIHDAFAYESPITSLQFDSRRIVSSNNEKTVKIYDRIEEKHSSCGGESEDNAIVNYVHYREGYLVEGRADGKIGIWAI